MPTIHGKAERVSQRIGLKGKPMMFHPVGMMRIAGRMTEVGLMNLKHHRGGTRGVALKPNRRGPNLIPRIAVSTHVPPRGSMFMETLVHEALHLLFPYASETKIQKSAEDLRVLLWRMGYRLVPTNHRPRTAKKGK